MHPSRLLLLALPTLSHAFWRMTCPGRLVQERADPIVSPGLTSSHVHTISGGSAFALNVSYDSLRTSKCTSCSIAQDLSVYWSPKLYFHNRANDTFTQVPQAGDGGGIQGGMTVYYQQRPGPDNDTLKAFPRDFRMIAGDMNKRAGSPDFASQAVSFVCLGLPASDPNARRPGLPDANCPDGLRAQIYFPSCWDGVRLDSPDHKSHVAYPESGSYDNGPCPATHPVHLVSIFFEIIYSVADFSPLWSPGHGDQPFVFAQGDPTGYGFHGDFVNGWDVGVLQSAVDDCNNDSGNMQDCPHFTLNGDAACQDCQIAPTVLEDVDGPLPALPGCNTVQPGPGPATPLPSCAQPAGAPVAGFPPPPPTPDQLAGLERFTDVTASEGFAYQGCGSDDYYARSLKGASDAGDAMTVQSCVDFCKGKGFTYAGLEYGRECYCDNSVPADRAPVPGVAGKCNMKCSGNQGEVCGGTAALSLYKACDGAACVNAGAQAGKRVKRHMHRHARRAGGGGVQ